MDLRRKARLPLLVTVARVWTKTPVTYVTIKIWWWPVTDTRMFLNIGFLHSTGPGGTCRCVRTGSGRRLVRGGRCILQERRSGPFCPRHLAPFCGGGCECSLLRHLEVPVLTGVNAAHVEVTNAPPSERECCRGVWEKCVQRHKMVKQPQWERGWVRCDSGQRRPGLSRQTLGVELKC